jgi:hypothetical protein
MHGHARYENLFYRNLEFKTNARKDTRNVFLKVHFFRAGFRAAQTRLLSVAWISSDNQQTDEKK